jgi:hypothetical protein
MDVATMKFNRNLTGVRVQPALGPLLHWYSLKDGCIDRMKSNRHDGDHAIGTGVDY